jgi:lipid A 3-O-deacylase
MPHSFALRYLGLFAGLACFSAPSFSATEATVRHGETSSAAVVSRGGSASIDPIDRWELSYETGILWSAGARATPLEYVVLPQLITLKTPKVSRRAFAGGDLVLRSRFSLLLEPIIQGPEHSYLGASASGCLEWWTPSRTTCLFFASGGGLGWMDSKGYAVKGGQGQDLNFNWLVYLGGKYQRGERFSATLGVYYQHVSNTGLDEVNPGLDAVGPMFSVGWSF